jgi:hypothetical protein
LPLAFLQYHLLLEEFEGEVVVVLNELVFAPIVEADAVVTEESERREYASSHE